MFCCASLSHWAAGVLSGAQRKEPVRRGGGIVGEMLLQGLAGPVSSWSQQEAAALPWGAVSSQKVGPRCWDGLWGQLTTEVSE